MKLQSTFLLAPLVASACITDPEALDTSDESSAIQGDGNTLASSFATARAGRKPWTSASGVTRTSCTVTAISQRFAVSAAHCGFGEGDVIELYDANTPSHTSFSRQATVDRVILRDGVDVSECKDDLFPDCDDVNGMWADIALLELNTFTPTISRATLAWEYPGSGAIGVKVGAGNHDGVANEVGALRQILDVTDDSSATDGSFNTGTVDTDGGDSGGPFYVSQRVLGVLWGERYNGTDAHYNLYTNVPTHLDWILDEIGYRWPGAPSLANIVYAGTLIDSFPASEAVCQYACEKTSTCDAYNYRPLHPQSCSLLANPTGATSQFHARGALRHGASSGKTNDVVSFVRADNKTTVVERSASGKIVERTDGSSTVTHSGAPSVATGAKISAYRRSDGFNVVLYRSTNNALIELVLTPSPSFAALAATNPVGDPVGYVRADGVDAVVYRSSDNHIRELRLTPSGWVDRDLMQGMANVASSDPHAFARADGYSSVLFREGTAIRELYKGDGETWTLGTPGSLVSGGVPAAHGRPFGYTRVDGTTAIAYRSSANIHELRNGTSWTKHQLTTAGQNPSAFGDPSAYVRADARNAVLYRGQMFGGDPVIAEIGAAGVSSLPGASVNGDPMPNVGADAISSVVRRHGSTQIGRISFSMSTGQSFAVLP